MNSKPEEILIASVAGLLKGCRHIAVGASSPIPGSAAYLAQELSDGATEVSVLGSKNAQFFTNGGAELFDMAAHGRIDVFFLSGGQIDGHGNINLVGVGDYPQQKVRWSGSFGSSYLYFIVPNVILFRWEHSRRTLVEQVDFISAPGTSPPNVYRPGGPRALITNLCLFDFVKETGRFRLASIHPGHTLEEVRDHTGFDFEIPGTILETPVPSAKTLHIIRHSVAAKIADPYPVFAETVFGIDAGDLK